MSTYPERHPAGSTDGRGSAHTSGALTVLTVAVAASLQLVVLVPFTVASGLLAPLWAVIGLHLLWAAGAVTLALLARRRPTLTLLVPLVNGALLATVITVGEQVLGWTG